MNDMIQQALETPSELKLLMKAEIVDQGEKKLGVTSIVFVSPNKSEVLALSMRN